MPPSRRRKPGRPSGDEAHTTRDALLGAARELFAESGYEGVSVRRIAEAAGVNPAMIHYHFGNKRELYREMLQGAVGSLLEGMQRALLSSGNEPQERVGAFFRTVMHMMAANPWLPRVVLRDVRSAKGAFRDHFVEQFAGPGARGLLVPWIRAEVQAGRMRPDVDPGIAAISLMSLAVWPFVAGPIVEGVFGMEVDAGFADRFADHNTRLFCQGTLLPGATVGDAEP